MLKAGVVSQLRAALDLLVQQLAVMGVAAGRTTRIAHQVVLAAEQKVRIPVTGSLQHCVYSLNKT